MKLSTDPIDCCRLQEALQAPSPPFEMLQIADIIPKRRRDDYAEAGGKI